MPVQFAKRFSRGFTLIELAVVAVIVGILSTLLLNRVSLYQEQAEKAAMLQMLGTVRSALHLQMGDALVNERMDDMRRLAEQNPMNWLAEKPVNYAGELYSPQPGMVDDGSWYFDPLNKNLVYLVSNRAHLQTAAGESNKIRFALKLVLKPTVNSKDTVTDHQVIEGMTLEPVVAYRWF